MCSLSNSNMTNGTERVLSLSLRSLADFAVDVLGVVQAPRGRGLWICRLDDACSTHAGRA